MPVNEWLAERVRAALSGQPDVYEKRMFGGIAFMVNGKMCICVSGARREDNLMVRVGPRAWAEAQTLPGASPTIMRGKPIKGYVDVDEVGQRDLQAWVKRALDFNRELVASEE